MADASGPTKEHQHERPSLRVFLLGGFRVEQDGREPPATAWGHRGNARTLVKLLALAPGHQLHREQLMDTLWPEADPDSARNSFAKALHAARHALEPTLPHRGTSAYLRLTDDMLALDLAHTWVDVDHFERLTRAALPADDVAALAHAIAAYGGELLPEDRYAEWATARRETLAAYYLQALLGLAGLHERCGDFNAALERLRQALQQDPACEDTHRDLMRLYARGGDRRQALRQYELCRVALREELAVEPDAATERLRQDILASARPAQTDVGQERAMEPDDATPFPLPPPLRRIPPTPLVGRERVLEILREGLVNAMAGHGGVTLVGGEAGVGKTRLVMEAAREAHRGDALILWGASYEREGVMPYGPFVEALEDYARGRAPEERAALAAYPELGHLLPSLALMRESAPAAAPSGGDGERARLFAAIARLLGDLATPRPLVLALDDLHAADVASLQLLHYLARAASERRWLIVGTYRDEDVTAGSPCGQLCATLMREELCRRVDLRQLAHPDCDAFVRALLPDGVVESALLERLYALSLGNPLFVQELVRLLREQGMLTLVNGSWQAPVGDVGAPRGVRDLVEARAQGLGDDVRHTLTLAAVIGMDCAFSLLSAVSDLAEEPLLDALDRALEAQILDEREGGYAFRHPLFRAALYERLSRARRARLHGAVARALEAQRPDEAEALAYHYEQSGDADRAIAHLDQAGDRARAVYANETAAARYGEAVDRLDGQGRSAAAASVREKLGLVLLTMGRYDEARAVLDRAALAYEAADDHEGLGRALAHIGHAYAFRGLPREGIARIQPALAHLEGYTSPGVLAALYVTLALLSFTHSAYTEQLAASARASDLARQVEDDSLRAEAEGWRGLALMSLGDPENACRVLEDVIPLAETAGATFALTGALHNLACIYHDWGELARSTAYQTRALELAERQGDPAAMAFFLFGLGCGDFYRGDWAGARAYLRRAEAASRATPSWCAPYPLMALGQLSLAEGAWEAATGYLEESLIPAEAAGDVQALRYAQSLLAERDLLDGRPEAVITRLSPLLDRPGLEESTVTEILPLLAWARLELGEHDAAREIAQQSVARARARRYRLILVDALRVQGLVALRQKCWLEAARALDEALSIAESIPYPYGRARALRIYGLLHVEIGELEPARERLEEALAIFQRLGARRDSARVEQALSGLR